MLFGLVKVMLCFDLRLKLMHLFFEIYDTLSLTEGFALATIFTILFFGKVLSHEIAHPSDFLLH